MPSSQLARVLGDLSATLKPSGVRFCSYLLGGNGRSSRGSPRSCARDRRIKPGSDPSHRCDVVGALLLEQNDEWAVQRARYMTLGRLYRASRCPKTGGRVVPLGPEARAVLSAIPREEDNTWVIAGHLPALPPPAPERRGGVPREPEPVQPQTSTPPTSNPGAARRRTPSQPPRYFQTSPDRRLGRVASISSLRPFDVGSTSPVQLV